MDNEQLSILRHALGLGANGRGQSYRNHFCTGPGSADYDNCQALVASGHMTRRKGSALSGGDDIFLVTDQGKAEARKRPNT